METIVLAGGCFWCLEASFNLIKGVESAIPGYCGGDKKDAEYNQVVMGMTKHAESVEVIFDTKVIGLADVFDVFWTIHNPTTLNRQGNDVGPQYRSAIFYASDAQKQAAENSIKAVQKLWDDPIVTELAQLEEFYPAEAYHRNYFDKNPEAAYCQIIINPKLQKLRQKFAERIK